MHIDRLIIDIKYLDFNVLDQFADKICIIATILFYENEVNELPVMFKNKVDKDELDSLKSDIADCIKEFDWSNHYDKYQLKLRQLILDKIPKK